MSDGTPLLTREEAYAVGFYAFGTAITTYITGPVPAHWHLEMAVLLFIMPTISSRVRTYREGGDD